MSRPYYALLALLSLVAGPLVFAPTARGDDEYTCPAEAYGHKTVCTPPCVPVHPTDTDIYGLLPYPGYEYEAPTYEDQYADADAAAEWDAELPSADSAPVEDWRDFAVENKPSSISNKYDDLFETMGEVADAGTSEFVDAEAEALEAYRKSEAAAAEAVAEAAIVEADPEAYQPEVTSASEFDPSAEAVAEAPSTKSDDEYSAIEAYESEFSGYGNYNYNDDYTPAAEKVAVSTKPLGITRVVRSLTSEALDNEFVNDMAQLSSEAYFMAQTLFSDQTKADLIEASENAWDRLEEHNRLSLCPLPVEDETQEEGFRLADDDCGWDCWHEMHRVEMAKKAQQTQLDRDALRAVAGLLRSLASQLEAASEWIGNVGVGVAEVNNESEAR
jgi:hypothetical protein